MCHFNLSWNLSSTSHFFLFAVHKKMLLVSMQQAEATRAEPVFVAPAQKCTSFLLSIWTILQTIKWLKINTFSCVHFYSLYPCSAHLHEISASGLIVLDLEYFVAGANYHFADTNREYLILHQFFLVEVKKSELQELNHQIIGLKLPIQLIKSFFVTVQVHLLIG